MHYDDYVEAIQNPQVKEKLISLVDFVKNHYDSLELVMKWNQPMFITHGTFIIGFSVAKTHINIAPEEPAITVFEDRLKALGYKRTKMLIQVTDKQPLDFDFIKAIIDFVIEDKKDITTFWR